VIKVQNIDAAIEYINSRDKPLALYLFSSSKKTVEKVQASTSSGSFVVNDTVLQVICNPFVLYVLLMIVTSI